MLHRRPLLESRVFEGNHPDARGFIWLECRVSSAADKWISVDGTLQARREIANGVSDLAHVVCRLDFEFPGQDIVSVSPLEIATTQLIGGEWKLILDAETELGLPGFRGIGFWIDPVPTTKAAGDEWVTSGLRRYDTACRRARRGTPSERRAFV